MLSLALWLGLAVLVPTVSAASYSGWDATKPRGDAVDLLSAAPADGRLVVAIENLSGAWDSPAVGTAIATVQSLTDMTGTLEAWSLLSKQIGLAPDDAAKRLLGRRFLLVSDGEGAGASWAIATVVDQETAGLLRKNLKAVPRSLRGGVPVLAIEGNAFELVVQDLSRGRAVGALSRGYGDGGALVVLGPSSRAMLFDEMMKSALSGAGGLGRSMQSESGGRLARALPDGTGVVVVRRDAEREHAWFVLGAIVERHAIRVNFLRQNPALAGSRTAMVTPWSLEVFDDLAEESLFAVGEVDALTSPMMPTLSEAFGPEIVARLKLPEGGVFAGRTMLLGFDSQAGPMELVGAFETPDVTRALIVTDSSVSRSLSGLLGGEAFEDFGGLFADALRKLDLRPALTRRNPQLLRTMWPQEGPMLAWTVRSSRARHEVGGSGWMILGLGEDRVRGVAEGLGAGAPAEGGGAELPWVSVFEVRPRLLIEQLAGRGVAPPPLVSSFGAVERVRAQALVARPDLLRGGGVIEFVRDERGGE